MSRPLPATPASCTTLHAHSAARCDGLWHAVTAAAKYLSWSFFALVAVTFSMKLLLQLPSIFSFPALLVLLFWLFCGQMAYVLRKTDCTEFVFAFGSSKPTVENFPGLGQSPDDAHLMSSISSDKNSSASDITIDQLLAARRGGAAAGGEPDALRPSAAAPSQPRTSSSSSASARPLIQEISSTPTVATPSHSLKRLLASTPGSKKTLVLEVLLPGVAIVRLPTHICH
jgi:hypothetical protein